MMSRRVFTALAAASAAVMLAGTAVAQEADHLTVEHAQGTTQVPLAPERVLVFDIPALDTLDALGVPGHGRSLGRQARIISSSTMPMTS